MDLDLDFLNGLKNIDLKPPKEFEKSFFDVAGYPHYENVASNILAFYFNCKNEHNMKELWIKSLIQCYDDRIENSKSHTDIVTYDLLNEEVEIREHNANGKRIDLLMSIENLVIVVENKIYAGDEGNPYDEYHEEAKNMLKDYCDDNGEILEILLSVEPREHKIENEYKFYNITYEELFKKVEENIGKDYNYIVNASEKWIIYMNEFIKNIEKLGEGYTMNLNNELQEKFADEKVAESIKTFYKWIEDDIEKKINFMKDIKNKINVIGDNKIVAGLWPGRGFSFDEIRTSVYIDIKRDDNARMVVEAYYDRINNPLEIKLCIWNRDNTKNEEYKRESELFKSIDKFKGELDDKGYWGHCIELKVYTFLGGLDSNELAKEWYDVADKLNKLYGNN